MFSEAIVGISASAEQ